MVICIAIVIVWIILYFVFDKEYEVKSEKYYRELPYDFDPEFLQYIYYGKEQKNTLWVTFLSLLQKGVYTIEKITNKVGVETYRIIFNKELKNMKEYQKEFIGLLNSYMITEDGVKSIDLLTLKNKMKNSASYRYRQYIKSLENEKESIFGEIEKPNIVVRIIPIIIMAIVIILITILTFVSGGLASLTIFFLTFTTIIYIPFFTA